jgi:hypothetical protein
MGRKGRRGRSKKAQVTASSAAAVVVLDESPVTLPSAGLPVEAPVASEAETSGPAEAGADLAAVGGVAPIVAAEPSAPIVAAEPSAPVEPAGPSAPVEPAEPSARVEPLTRAAAPVEPAAPADVSTGKPEAESPEPSVPPVGDLDARFFAESMSEVWLAHELELRDPQLLRKMTASVARRRARFARYVVGVVGVAVALCLAALIKSAVPVGSDDSRPHPAAQMAMPAADSPLPPAVPVPAAVEPAAADGVDGGG